MNESKKPEKMVKTRVSVTMTKPYVDALDNLVEHGVYMTRGDTILDALRHFFREKGIELPYHKEV